MRASSFRDAVAVISPGMLMLGLLGMAGPLPGTFALQSGIPRTAGHLTVDDAGRAVLSRGLDFWMTRTGSATALRHYDVDMTRYLHLVIISADFRTFVHAHPRFSPNGHFTLVQRFPRPALYHIYADGEPRGIGQQVFRFDVLVGHPRSGRTRDLVETSRFARAGPYLVMLDKLRLSTRRETMLHVHIRVDGKPARDLHPYLGALAHAVFLDAGDLTYVHAHPLPLAAANVVPSALRKPAEGAMSGMQMGAAAIPPHSVIGPDMLLHVAVREAGTYKLWLQFRGGRTVRVASFVLTAR